MRIAVLTVAAALAVPAALAQDYPKLKAGQWEMTLTSTRTGKDVPPTKTTMCTDDALQKEMTSMGAGVAKEMCTKNEIRREGARYVGLSECNIGGSRSVSRTVMTLTGDTGYRMEIDTTYDPPMMGLKQAHTVLEGRHVGPCRDGLVPGDFVGPGGQKMNIKGIGAAKTPAPSRQPAAKPRATQ